jgi:hypothetical protein
MYNHDIFFDKQRNPNRKLYVMHLLLRLGLESAANRRYGFGMTAGERRNFGWPSDRFVPVS